jgi:hypothetical protein
MSQQRWRYILYATLTAAVAWFAVPPLEAQSGGQTQCYVCYSRNGSGGDGYCQGGALEGEVSCDAPCVFQEWDCAVA